jgi:YfiH family protein
MNARTQPGWATGAHEDWIIPQWPAPANVRALITTRNGGVSQGVYASFNLGAGSGDDMQAVTANRARLRKVLPAEPAWLKQVHGTGVVHAETVKNETEADASVTRAANTVCLVMVADCLPVLLADQSGTVVGAAHAGWRGLRAGVIERTAEAMRSEPANLLAYLGPCISAAVYEVGDDVRDAFCAVDTAAEAAFIARPGRPGKWLADLPLLARQRLTRIGVGAQNIYGGTDCTLSNPQRFFSYRRDGASGRLGAMIWRT